ncbi:MAG: hypothetical protein U0174_03560 [Polyangiaceae bacterium]
MRFVLRYSGSLPSNAKAETKSVLRVELSQQLEELWRHPPLSSCDKLRRPPEREGEFSNLRERGGCSFIPLVTAQARGLTELDIVLLRPEPAGNLITRGGDIDNRMKTLFDALSMPAHVEQVGQAERTVGAPIYCLLEDDNLVSSLRVRTEQLLLPSVDPSHAELLITVETRVTMSTWGNGHLS